MCGLTREQSLVVSVATFVQTRKSKFTLLKVKQICCSRTKYRVFNNIIYCYIEEIDGKYMRKMYPFLNTMNTRVNPSIEKAAKNKTKNILSISYGYPINRGKRPRFILSQNVRISRKNVPFRKIYKSHFTNEIFRKLFNLLQINH